MPQLETTDLQSILKEKDRIERAGRLHWVHWAVVAASLILTLGAFYIAKTESDSRIEAQYKREATQVVELIIERMQKYEVALASAMAFVQTKEGYTTNEMWKYYSANLDLENQYPGINGIGIIHNIPASVREGYESYMRKDRPNFRIYPEHDEAELFPIAFIEPVENNAAAVGLDVAHENNRYEAAKKARDTGVPQITGPIILVQDAERTPGFLFYYPYAKRFPELKYTQMGQRRQALVYAPFIIKNLMEGTLGTESRQVGLKIYDSGEVLFDENNPDAVDFDPKALFATKQTIDMYGRKWDLEIRSRQSFRAATADNKPWMILVGGLIIDSLLLGLFVLLARSNQRAVQFASNMAESHETKAMELDNFIDNAADGLLKIAQGGIIQSYNKACEHMFGYTSEEIVGQDIRTFIPVLKKWRHDIDGVPYQRIGRRKDGTEFPIEITIRIIHLEGEPYYSAVIRDISERKQAEDAMQRTMEKLEQSNADLERFAYIASHDLKSPLRAIDNLSAWIAEDVSDKLDEENKSRITSLRGRVKRMENLLESLLQYSRASNQKYEEEIINANNLINDIAETLNVPDGFEIEVSENLSSMNVIRMPLEQVFHNLISNALKHHDKETGKIRVSGTDHGDHIVFSVKDDGPGIEQEYQERIFEMFQTLKRRDDVESSGIGLALVKKTVQRYDGEITLVSNVGEGSTFTFTWKQGRDKLALSA